MSKYSQYIDKLLKNALFKQISADTLENLIEFEACILGQYKKNALIVQESDHCYAIGFILKGILSIHQSSSSGENITIELLKEGESFGAGVLLSSEPFYRYNILANSDADILYIPFAQIKRMLRENAVFNTNYITFLSDKLLVFKNKIEILAKKNVRTRIITYLSSEIKKSSSLTIKIPHSKTQIAQLIGVARPSLSRELQCMQQEKLLKFDHNTITILKPEIFLP
ncbi:MAG: Crp/Fnr family transcriptional regulator [Bacillota bacterium]|jgi:CRP-like cAMP-binding protein